MPDVFLYPGAPEPNDVILRNPSLAAGGSGAITGIAAITEADDTLSASGILAPIISVRVRRHGGGGNVDLSALRRLEKDLREKNEEYATSRTNAELMILVPVLLEIIDES